MSSLRARLRHLAGYGALPVLVFRRFGWKAPAHIGGLVWRHLRVERQRLSEIPIASRQSSHAVADEAIRWQNPASTAGTRRTSLSVQPDSAVTWEITAPPYARVAAWATVNSNLSVPTTVPVRFTICVQDTGGATLAENSAELSPRAGDATRQWRRLAAPLRNRAPRLVRVTLRTTATAVGAGDLSCVWGDPQVETDRSLAQMAMFLRREFAEKGFAGALTGLRVDARGYGEDLRRYQRWVAQHTLSAQQLATLAAEVKSLSHQPRISVLMPVYNTNPKWLAAAIASVQRQAYDNWELCIADDASTDPATLHVLDEADADGRIRVIRRTANGHICAASNDALALATGEFVALLDHDDELAPDALAEMVRAINEHPDADVFYSDEDKLSTTGARLDPFFKPDWSPEHFEGQMYTCHLTVMRTSEVRAVGGFREGYEGAQDYDLWLRMLLRTSRICHVPRVLYHWRMIEGSAAAAAEAKPYAIENARRALDDYTRARRVPASVEPGVAPGLWRMRRALGGEPEVTIVIPTAGRSAEVRGQRVDLLVHALRSIETTTTWKRRRVLVVDNGDLRTETLRAIENIPHQRLSYQLPAGPFNFSRKLNFAMRHAQTDYLVMFNDDIEIITPDWIEALLEYAQDRAIGAVGCKLRFPDGRLQHVGVVTGVTGIATHVFHQAPPDSFGWNGGAVTVRNYSAVTGAVMMTRRDAWDRVGGFDERLRVDFNDVDFCLKLREAGYRIVFTPYAECYHHESGSFGARQQNPDDVAEMRRKWGEALERDPYYNPNLTLDTPDCRLPV